MTARPPVTKGASGSMPSATSGIVASFLFHAWPADLDGLHRAGSDSAQDLGAHGVVRLVVELQRLIAVEAEDSGSGKYTLGIALTTDQIDDDLHAITLRESTFPLERGSTRDTPTAKVLPTRVHPSR